MEDEIILSRKFLFVLLIAIVSIGIVSAVSAQDLNDTAHSGDDLKTDDLPEGIEINHVGGACDHVGDEQPLNCASATVTILQAESQNQIPAKIEIQESGQYYGEKMLKVKVLDDNDRALYSVPVDLKFSNGKSVKVITESNGEATYKLPFDPGTYSVNAKVVSNILKVDNARLDKIKIKHALATISMKKLSTSFGAKKYFQIKVINSKTKNGIGGVKLLIKVYSKGKVKKIYRTTNSKGIAKFNTAKLNVGIHKVKVRELSKAVSAKAKTSKIKVKKAPTTFLDEVGAVYIKKSGIYDIAVFNKNTEKSIKGVKLTVKVFTGKGINTYVVKTGKYGSSIDLSYLGLGSYKVVVKFDGNSRYKKCMASDYIDVLRSSGNVFF